MRPKQQSLDLGQDGSRAAPADRAGGWIFSHQLAEMHATTD
jgi:hypothetical protein